MFYYWSACLSLHSPFTVPENDDLPKKEKNNLVTNYPPPERSLGGLVFLRRLVYFHDGEAASSED